MKHPRPIFMYFLLLAMLKPFLIGFFILSGVAHPIRNIESKSSSGRTHYQIYRPFSEKFTNIFDFGVPIHIDEDNQNKIWCLSYIANSGEVRIKAVIERKNNFEEWVS